MAQPSAKRPRTDAGEGGQRKEEPREGGPALKSDLFQMAKGFAADGQISHPEAKELVEQARTAGMTADDAATLRRTMEVFRYTQKAADFIKPLIEAPKVVTSYYRQINGVKYDRELLDLAETFAADGQISFSEAFRLWEAARDGQGVTAIERRTLRYTMATMRYTPKASQFLQGQLCKLEGQEEAGIGGKGPAQGRAGAGEQPVAAAAEEQARGPRREPVTAKWVWVRRPGSAFPAYPVVLPRKEHRFTLVMCHPMGCYSTFFLGPAGLVKDLLVRSRRIRDHCKIICPGARRIGWGKQWFRYRSNRGGTRRCHAEVISTRDLQRAVDFVSGVVANEVGRLGSPGRVLLGGYSQGGCISLAVGLAQPYDLGLVISQRGMLMQQTMDRHSPERGTAPEPSDGAASVAADREGAAPVAAPREMAALTSKPRVLITAGVLDDVYLLANQVDGKEWLEKHGCRVDFMPIETLDHYENSQEEHTIVRKACLAAFCRAEKSPAVGNKK